MMEEPVPTRPEICCACPPDPEAPVADCPGADLLVIKLYLFISLMY